MKIVDYLHLLSDNPRIEAFRGAIEASVSPGQVVLDLGTGLGTYAMFAARAGAKVYAVEADPVIEVARQLAVDNGLADRITFLEGWASDLEPPERADVLIFEDYSPYGCEPETAILLEDVRRRWLKSNAVAIPRSLRIMLAPVSCPATYDVLVPWGEDEPYGLDIQRLTHRVLNNLHHVGWREDVLLGPAIKAAEVDPLASDLKLSIEASWQASRAAELHGLGLWLEFDLARDLSFSNAPTNRSSGWDQIFLPLTQPVTVEQGGRISARVKTIGSESVGGDAWWSWQISVGGWTQEMNSFRGTPLTMGRLRRAGLAHQPKLTPKGGVRRVALELMDGRHNVEEIGAELQRRFPEFFVSTADAYRFLGREMDTAVAPANGTDAAAVARSGGNRK